MVSGAAKKLLGLMPGNPFTSWPMKDFAGGMLGSAGKKVGGNKGLQKLGAMIDYGTAFGARGTPYDYGGGHGRIGVPGPKGGFDCSGYVMFVFAHFGIALPHSVHEQARIGVKIKPEDAMPGDVVIMSDLSHSGIYAGNGNFYHAPRPGDTVKLAPIFTSNIFFVRFGTK